MSISFPPREKFHTVLSMMATIFKEHIKFWYVVSRNPREVGKNIVLMEDEYIFYGSGTIKNIQMN